MAEDRSPSIRLQALNAVTDWTLKQLDLDKLLAVLLERTRELLAVDTVTVLLVDRGGTQLVARATLGLEEEVFQECACLSAGASPAVWLIAASRCRSSRSTSRR